MHIIFERTNGTIKSNCNILTLAWMPHYNESTFRRAHLAYHQRLLTHLTGPIGVSQRVQANEAPQPTGRNINQVGLQEILRQQHQAGGGTTRAGQQRDDQRRQFVDLATTGGRWSPSKSDLDQLLRRPGLANSRLHEQFQRYVYMKHQTTKSVSHTRRRGRKADSNACGLAEMSNAAINDQIDELYGQSDSFGWLAIGNIGKLVGVTLTSIVRPPPESDRRERGGLLEKGDNVDLINLEDDSGALEGTESNDTTTSCNRNHNNQQQVRPDSKSARSNYNLRGHLDEIILVKWNELYQKLASVDSKGNVLIWSKTNDKFTIQTPFYNKSKSVADFKWSNDGKTALICYTDSFILVGGSSGQRHWHSMLNLDDYHITCATWTPNDEQLLLGVSNGNIVLIDLPNSELTELAVGQANIRTMCWSSGEINLRHLDLISPPSRDFEQGREEPASKFETNLSTRQTDDEEDEDQSTRAAEQQLNSSTVVNRRRLSRNCALFCRYRPPQATNQTDRIEPPARRSTSNTRQRHFDSFLNQPQRGHKDILAVDFADNTIKLFDGGLDDKKPRQIQVNLESYLMAWSSDGQILAVAGFNIYTSAPSVGYLRCKYLNAIKFYNQEGQLVYERRINFTRYPITALTWAHEDKRLFVATGPRLHCAKVFMGVPKLSLLSLSCLYRHTKLMDKLDALKALSGGQSAASPLGWQSSNCPIDIGSRLQQNSTFPSCVSHDQQLEMKSASSNTTQLLAMSPNTTVDLDSSSGSSSGGGNETSQEPPARLVNNINIASYQLPAKLKSKIDQLFLKTIRQPFDEQFTLSDIAWHVPRHQQRIYCTLICYTHELPDVGCIGHQYKVQDQTPNGMGAGSSVGQQRASSSSGDSLDADHQFKIFILYAEFEGSLIPILKARRIGLLKPEFVVFDPEPQANNSFQRYLKVSDVSHGADGNRFGVGSFNSPPEHAPGASLACASLHSSAGDNIRVLTSSSGSAFPHANRKMLDNFHSVCLPNPSQQQKFRCEGFAPGQADQQHELLRAIERQRVRDLRAKLSGFNQNLSSAGQSAGSGMRSLPEDSELIRIKSNIWGTKFKLVNVSNKMINQRALLGSVKYKASLLHLQPRQIFLNLKDMSNYCALCSMHHHTRLPSKSQLNRQRSALKVRSATSGVDAAKSTPLSLIDFPLATDYLATPLRTSSGRLSRHRQGLAQRLERQSSVTRRASGDEKLILTVGDSIRVAPKLEPNQKYHLVSRQTHTPTSVRRHQSLLAQSSAPSSAQMHSTRVQFDRKHPHRQPIRGVPVDVAKDGSNEANQQVDADDDHILTLSLDQGDQVQLEMSSVSLNQAVESNLRSSQRPVDNVGQKMDDFLQANKTLKSIQTITKMIVDLSSRAQDDDSKALDISQQPSPVKLLRTGDFGQKSPARQYIAPETPVHRPRRFASGDHSSRLRRAQSAANSPLAERLITDRSIFEPQRPALDPDDPLPPPPPSVPFRRKLSTSAKRFFDGSLRSLSSLGVSGGSGYTAGHLTGDDADSEEGEILVRRRLRHKRSSDKRSSDKRSQTNYFGHQSQPCTPMRSAPRQTSLDLASLRSQVVQKLRLSTSWLSTALDANESKSPMRAHDSSKRQSRSASCTKRSSWIHRSSRNESSQPRSPPGVLSRSASQSSSSSSHSSGLASLLSNSSSCSSSSNSLPNSDHEQSDSAADFGFLDRATRSRLFKKSSRLSSSVREFGLLNGKSKLSKATSREKRTSERPTTKPNPAAGSQVGGQQDRPSRQRRRRRCGAATICSSANCCCAREFKLSNRPPVWNEFSQVYQLDFGGRVTQESAKNLQIDFNGSLALQFGRIDKCTYTLDYQHPFNAVQAMSIALASLTQRLK